ncbi:MAG: aldolase/citrate lyase family protein [Caldilineaceae bacterium]|nr:aldolase/citrate lyase family protein [Caldilineaceae bacterium]
MQVNRVRQAIRSGQNAFGCFMGMGSGTVAELLAHAGCEWLVVEMEHNGIDMAEVEQILMAMNSTDTVPMVRIPSADPVFIQRSLDIGALGIAVPMVKTAAEAEAIVQASRYPPHGRRSFGPLRASNYTIDYGSYFDNANDNILILLILETAEAVENLEEIANVPGIDVLYIGAFDLCLSLGLNPFDMPLPEIDKVIDHARDVAGRCDVALGIGSGSPEELRQRAAQGFTFLGYGPDYQLLLGTLGPGVEAYRSLE